MKKEHLKTELTALSHTAILRVTPQEDQDVHIVINPNSDEGEGYIEIDTLNHRVYGYNPVHRIYQGWGEPAGFSGHFVLEYPEGLVDFGVFSKESKKERDWRLKVSASGLGLLSKVRPKIDGIENRQFVYRQGKCDFQFREGSG